MKNENIFKQGSRRARSLHGATAKSLLVCSLIFLGLQTSLQAQDSARVSPTYTPPTWWFGVAAGANFNFYRGTTQELNSDLTVPTAFNKGSGIGLFVAPLVEYRFRDSHWGIMLQAGYDGRNGKFESVVTPCNCVADLSTNLHYITVEPSLRFAPFKSNFYVFVGPQLAFNVSQSFNYSQKVNKDFPTQTPVADVKADFSKMNSVLLSMQVGAGYDIPLTTENHESQMVLSPFVSFQPYLGQDPRSIETWTVTTLRVGAALKFGKGGLIESKQVAPVQAAVVDPLVDFSVISPENIVSERRIRETFPLRNYIFFDLGSAEIPDRYVLLTKDQVKDFKEDRLEVFAPKRLSGRSDREMVVYYNVLNILGDRMGQYPNTEVRLEGSSRQGKKDGLAMADNVKNYLVSVFKISPSRINTEGSISPKNPSEQKGGTKELDLLREGDRRVSISSKSPELMSEYQTGPNVPLKPVVITAVQEAPVDSYVTFNAAGANDAFSSWSLQIKNKANNKVKYFGPYTQERVSLPGRSILSNEPQGDFTATMIGQTKSGKTVEKDVPLHIVLWKAPSDEEGIRYSVIFEFNDEKAITVYQEYLTNVVAPKIPIGATVIIHGYTDTIGDAAHNLELSTARSNDVERILKDAMANGNRNDVTFKVRGFGEDPNVSPFANNFPEERFYNRTVIIDIIPKK